MGTFAFESRGWPSAKCPINDRTSFVYAALAFWLPSAALILLLALQSQRVSTGLPQIRSDIACASSIVNSTVTTLLNLPSSTTESARPLAGRAS